MDPYAILGIEHGASNIAVKQAYRTLVMKTHPDKSKDSTLFNIIQAAYNTIKRERRHEQRYPDAGSKHSYVPMTSARKQANIKEDDFSNKSFNVYYETHAMKNQRKGYGAFMMTGERESDEHIYKTPIQNTFSRTVSKYKVPQAMEASFLTHYEYLGKKEKDRSNTCGFDYLRAHVEAQKITSKRKAYTSIGDVMQDRENVSREMTAEEAVAEAARQKYMRKIERLRQQAVRSRDSTIERHYEHVNNLLA